MVEKTDEPTLITAMPVHGGHSRPRSHTRKVEAFARKVAVVEYGKGWDAHRFGLDFDENQTASWQEGWKRREQHDFG